MIEACGTTSLRPARDARLLPYAFLGIGGPALALLTSEPLLAALGLPFTLALALGLRRTTPIEVRSRIEVDEDRILEGDPVTGRIVLEWEGRFDASIRLHRPGGVTFDTAGVEPRSTPGLWEIPDAEGGVEIPFHLRADRWGRHRLAEPWLRLERPHGMLIWTGRLSATPELRILPGRETLSRLLDPAESRAVWGIHRSRRIGEGHEFAELRPYHHGDRLRDLNWAATARLGRPFVNRHHPDLSGDVVIALDAFLDGSEVGNETLSRAARAAWALASAHLRANDRVGVLGFGGSARRLPPGGGSRARYQLLETLLAVGGDAADRVGRGARTSMPAPPPRAALVLALTPLHDRATLELLAAWRHRGRTVRILVVDASMASPATPAERLARRLWRLELARRRRTLASLGIPTVLLPADGAISPAVSALHRIGTRAGRGPGR